MDVKDVVNVLIEQNKSFKEMMQWSIGSILGILVLFLAANFYTMRKVRNEEIERIKSEVRTELTSDIRETILPDLQRDVQNHLQTDLNEKLTFLATSLGDIKGKLNLLEERQNDTSLYTNNEIYYLEGEIYYVQAELYMFKKSYSMAFDYYLDSGKSYVESGNMDNIATILGRLEEVAKNLTYLGNDLPYFTEFAGTLEDKHRHQTEKIIDILKGKDGIASIIITET